MNVMKRIGIVSLWVLLVLVTAVSTAAIKQRFADGPNRVFSGGALVSGQLHRGAEPDWAFVNETPTIELQLLDPVQSRRIWTASVDGALRMVRLHEQLGRKALEELAVKPSVMVVRSCELKVCVMSANSCVFKVAQGWKR